MNKRQTFKKRVLTLKNILCRPEIALRNKQWQYQKASKSLHSTLTCM